MYMSLLGKSLQMLTLTPFPMCYSLVPMNGTPLFWITATLPYLVTPPGLQTLPYAMPMTPASMNLAILMGEFSIPSSNPLLSPTLLSTNMLSPLNPLTLRSSGPILAGSTNTRLRKHSTKPLNGLLLPLGTP